MRMNFSHRRCVTYSEAVRKPCKERLQAVFSPNLAQSCTKRVQQFGKRAPPLSVPVNPKANSLFVKNRALTIFGKEKITAAPSFSYSQAVIRAERADNVNCGGAVDGAQPDGTAEGTANANANKRLRIGPCAQFLVRDIADPRSQTRTTTADQVACRQQKLLWRTQPAFSER